LRLAVILYVESEGQKEEHEAFTSDLSQHGLGISTTASLIPGQLVEVMPTEGPPLSVRSRVVWVGNAESDTGGKAGLEFLTPLPTVV